MKNNLDSIIEEWEKVLMRDCGNLEITWGDLVDGDIKPLQDFLTKALTEAHQQGFKEAVEIHKEEMKSFIKEYNRLAQYAPPDYQFSDKLTALLDE